MSKNGGPSRILMHVDTPVALWAFFDLYGTTQRVAIAGSIPPKSRRTGSCGEFLTCLPFPLTSDMCSVLNSLGDSSTAHQLQQECLANQNSNSGSSLPLTQSALSRQPSSVPCVTYSARAEGSQVQSHIPPRPQQSSKDSHNAQLNGTSRLTNPKSQPIGNCTDVSI